MSKDDTKEKMVKGTMLAGFVRIIRSNKELPLEKYLTEADIETVNDQIFPTGWYPFDLFQRCGRMILHEVANNDLNAVRAFGKFDLKELAENTYHSIIEAGDLFKAVEFLDTIRNRFFNFTAPVAEKIDDNFFRIHLENAPDEPALEAFCHQIVGGYEYLIEFYGGKNVKITWERAVWKGDKDTSFVLAWD